MPRDGRRRLRENKEGFSSWLSNVASMVTKTKKLWTLHITQVLTLRNARARHSRHWSITEVCSFSQKPILPVPSDYWLGDTREKHLPPLRGSVAPKRRRKMSALEQSLETGKSFLPSTACVTAHQSHLSRKIVENEASAGDLGSGRPMKRCC